jgi:hypothetical protein
MIGSSEPMCHSKQDRYPQVGIAPRFRDRGDSATWDAFVQEPLVPSGLLWYREMRWRHGVLTTEDLTLQLWMEVIRGARETAAKLKTGVRGRDTDSPVNELSPDCDVIVTHILLSH